MSQRSEWGGKSWGEYVNDAGHRVEMFRKGQKVRFFDSKGRQFGPEQRNVAPAVAAIAAAGYYSPGMREFHHLARSKGEFRDTSRRSRRPRPNPAEERFWYFGLVNSVGGLRERFGPFETRNAAQQARGRMLKLGGFGPIGHIHSSKERYPANMPAWMRTTHSNPTEKMHEHVAEYYQLKPESIGKFLRRIEIPAPDSREAFFIAHKKLKPHEMVAVFQGSIGHQGHYPVAFGGTYSVKEWERLRDAYGGGMGALDAIKAELKQKSFEIRGA